MHIDNGTLLDGYDDEDEKDYYDFKEYVNLERDVAFFQITKPFTDLPYTLVVRDFSSKGKNRSVT